MSGQQVADAGLTGWANLGNGLYTRVTTPDFATGLAFVNAIAAATEASERRPDLTLRSTHVDVTVVDPDTSRVTEDAVAVARVVTGVAVASGLTPNGREVSRINLALDTPATPEVLPFWRALLAYEDRPGAPMVRDPAGRLPSVWFQSSGSDEPRQRWHLDVWVDPSQVRPRIDACLATGGRVDDDSGAPAFWVLADAEGNRSCLATWQGRD